MVVLVVAFVALQAQPQDRLPTSFDYARVTVERKIFMSKGDRYEKHGTFDGVGMMNPSISEGIIAYRGIHSLGGKRYWRQNDDVSHEILLEIFTIKSFIRLSETEYAFEALGQVNGRRLTGKIRYKLDRFGATGKVEEFQADEHGSMYSGVMNSYRLAASPEALNLLEKFKQVFLGDNVVSINLERPKSR